MKQSLSVETKANTRILFGVGYVNLPSIGAEVCLPFGNLKVSGNEHQSKSPRDRAQRLGKSHRVRWSLLATAAAKQECERK